jgi:hypothetical protein
MPLIVDGVTEVPELDASTVDRLCAIYLARPHKCHPVLDQDEVIALCREQGIRGFPRTIDTALVLVMCALASASTSIPTLSAKWAPGNAYFRPALDIAARAHTSGFSTDIRLPQTLILCAIYHGYCVRPAQAWRIVHMASTSFQLLLMQQVPGSRCSLIQSLTVAQISGQRRVDQVTNSA